MLTSSVASETVMTVHKLSKTGAAEGKQILRKDSGYSCQAREVQDRVSTGYRGSL